MTWSKSPNDEMPCVSDPQVAEDEFNLFITGDVHQAAHEFSTEPLALEGSVEGDTIEVHWVHTTCDVDPGKGLGSCLSDACANPQLRVEAQVFLVVNDENALSAQRDVRLPRRMGLIVPFVTRQRWGAGDWQPNTEQASATETTALHFNPAVVQFMDEHGIDLSGGQAVVVVVVAVASRAVDPRQDFTEAGPLR